MQSFKSRVRSRSFTRTGAVLAIAMTAIMMIGLMVSVPADATDEFSACHDASLTRQRTEVDTDMSVPQFDPALGTLLEVSVPEQAIHLDTDAVFENVAQSAVVFQERMDYLVTFTSPGGLASPSTLSGTIQRVPAQTLAAFDGTLDFTGPSAVAQPPTVRDESAAPVSATDQPTLDAFTGTSTGIGTMTFHMATQISETFMGGGGNVQAQINTYVAGEVRVCYRYAPPATPPPAPQPAPPTQPQVQVSGIQVTRPPAAVTVTPAFTG